MAHVSIVLPSWNTAEHIERAIGCYIAQEHDDKSLIIVDSKSDDGTHEIIARHEGKDGIRWLREPEKGLSNAINIGIRAMPEGAVFGYVGADDFLEPGALAAVSAHFDAKPEAVGVFFDSYTQRAGAEPRYRACPAETFSMENLLRYRSVAGMQNTFLRRDIARAYLFAEDVKLAMDYELFLRLAKDGLGEKITHIPQASTINTADGNLSRVYKRASKREALFYALKYAPPGWPKLRAWLRFLKYRWV
ncbi:MAG: glycosyltransferase [Roseovarius sp.]